MKKLIVFIVLVIGFVSIGSAQVLFVDTNRLSPKYFKVYRISKQGSFITASWNGAINFRATILSDSIVANTPLFLYKIYKTDKGNFGIMLDRRTRTYIRLETPESPLIFYKILKAI